MKKITLLFFLASITLQAQNTDYLKKVQTIDSTVKTLYAVISGEKGEERNWELFKFLFHKDAKLIPSGTNPQGVTGARFLTPEGYIKTSGKWLYENGFYEKEIGRKTERFGNIAHLFSTYESFRSKKDTKPFMRGINSIQLLYDGKRWWILNVYWQAENQKHPIPEKYID
ncbi:hypothetical protein [Pseudotenacibaculum haliotis]|uniref:Nuclear transport factor 2 family protein n=1 Tax=Pseudotenacibaculum haliotis TaxID=1862138 RepID=A0ABW5LQ49_9FLAO